MFTATKKLSCRREIPSIQSRHGTQLQCAASSAPPFARCGELTSTCSVETFAEAACASYTHVRGFWRAGLNPAASYSTNSCRTCSRVVPCCEEDCAAAKKGAERPIARTRILRRRFIVATPEGLVMARPTTQPKAGRHEGRCLRTRNFLLLTMLIFPRSLRMVMSNLC
jgi:hypothetical protein